MQVSITLSPSHDLPYIPCPIDSMAVSVFPFSLNRDGKYKFIWGYDGWRDGWDESDRSPNGATASWDMPWNLELLGLPVNDTLVTSRAADMPQETFKSMFIA